MLLREDKTTKTDWTYIYEMYPSFERVMKRFMLGEKKYSRLNFRDCEDYTTYKQSTLRHVLKGFKGDCEEDNLAAAVVNLLIIMDSENK